MFLSFLWTSPFTFYFYAVYRENALGTEEMIEFRFHFPGCFQGYCEEFVLYGHDHLLSVRRAHPGSHALRGNQQPDALRPML